MYCYVSVSEPTSPLQRPPPSLSLLSLKSSSVWAASPPPPHPSALPLCSWCIIMSVGEGMACLCAPEGLRTHCLKEKDMGLNTTQPSSFQAPFHPPTTVVLGLYGTGRHCFSHSHTHKHTKRHVDNKDSGGGDRDRDRVWSCVLGFFPSYSLVCMYSWGTWDLHATRSPCLSSIIQNGVFHKRKMLCNSFVVSNQPANIELRAFWCCG